MLMVAVTILAVVAFVVLPQLDYNAEMAGPNELIVSTKYGDIHRQDLLRLQEQLLLANQYVNNALAAAGLQGPDNYFGNPSDEAGVLRTFILAHSAKEAGMQVTDERIVNILDQMTGSRLTGEQFNQIAKQLRVQDLQVMEALRHQLLAFQFQQIDFTGAQVPTPYDQWKLFESLHRFVSVELVPLPVADYVAKAPKPTEAQLLAFFEQYKQDETTVNSGKPGFRQPKRAAFQYFRVRRQDFLSQVAVTDEEIAARYERDKSSLYRYPDDAAAPQQNPFATQGAEMESGVPTDDEPVMDSILPVTPEEAPAESPADEAASGATELPGTGTPPTEGETLPVETPSEGPASETPATEEPATEEPATEEPATGEPQSAVKRSPFRLASYLQEPSETPAQGDAAPAETPNGEAPAADEVTPPALEDAAPTTAATDETTPPATDSALTTATVEPPSEDQLPISLQDGPKPPFQPLWTVRDKVRDSIAQDKAFEMMDKVMADLAREMRSYETKRRGWVALSARDKTAKEPAPLAFDDIARKYGVEAKKTPLMAPDAIYFSTEYAIGKSYLNGRYGDQAFFFPLAAYSNLGLYRSTRSQDLEGNYYLFWKIEEKEAYVPEFAEVRAQVKEAWELQEARKIAIETANKLAEEARKAKVSLKEAFAARPDLQVMTPSVFTWRTGGMFDGRITMGTVQGVPDVGNDFMKVVYGLGVGDVGVATNEPQSTVYLVQLQNSTPDTQALYNQFLSTPYGFYAQAGTDESRQNLSEWLNHISQQAQVQWQQAPQEVN